MDSFRYRFPVKKSKLLDFLKDPIVGSVISIILTFIAVFLGLWLGKPDIVVRRDTKRKKKIIIWGKVVAYSALGAVIVGIIVLIWMADVGHTKKKSGFRFGSRYGTKSCAFC
uniref:Membrane protein n=1 Tax=Iridovirus LCIVAC01 TaxID=2506607 RepID=A0A481YRB8_9VIRU|nr:MAG: membrane protein [Iridovirus LCIVAC01]